MKLSKILWYSSRDIDTEYVSYQVSINESYSKTKSITIHPTELKAHFLFKVKYDLSKNRIFTLSQSIVYIYLTKTFISIVLSSVFL